MIIRKQGSTKQDARRKKQNARSKKQEETRKEEKARSKEEKGRRKGSAGKRKRFYFLFKVPLKLVVGGWRFEVRVKKFKLRVEIVDRAPGFVLI